MQKTGEVHGDEDMSIAPKGFQGSRNVDHCSALEETPSWPLCLTLVQDQRPV